MKIEAEGTRYQAESLAKHALKKAEALRDQVNNRKAGQMRPSEAAMTLLASNEWERISAELDPNT